MTVDFSRDVKDNNYLFLNFKEEVIENFDELANFLNSNLNITKLSLGNCSIDKNNIGSLVNSIKHSNVTDLDIQNNELDVDGIAVLFNSNIPFTNLNLQNNNIGYIERTKQGTPGLSGGG